MKSIDWSGSTLFTAGMMQRGLRYGMIVGVAGFGLGFFGPMLLDPSSGNGPLLGIFITGPLGALIGSIVGILHELRLRQSKPRV